MTLLRAPLIEYLLAYRVLILEREVCITGEIVVHGHSVTVLRRVVGFNSLSVLRGIVLSYFDAHQPFY